MRTKPSQKQIGQRIRDLRKRKGLSQEDLAKRIGMSRPSLAQIELGNRSLDILESYDLSYILGFSLDNFVSSQFNENESLLREPAIIEDEPQLRISVPEQKTDKLQNVFLYLLEQCAGKPNVSEPVLNNLLYFCDFNYYELYEEHLTGSRYKKLPFGPVPQKLDRVLDKMIDSGQIVRIKTEYHGFPQIRFLPLKQANLTQLTAAEKSVIDSVVHQMSDWNAQKINEYSHQDKPWRSTEPGDFISYNLVFYRRPPFSVRNYPEDEKDY